MVAKFAYEVFTMDTVTIGKYNLFKCRPPWHKPMLVMYHVSIEDITLFKTIELTVLVHGSPTCVIWNCNTSDSRDLHRDRI